MSWPELQIEHLAVAVIISWIAFGWFCWGFGQKSTETNSDREAGWNWLGGAALLVALQFVAWLALVQLRLESWPEWARTVLAIFTATHGVAACLAAWTWMGRPLSRAGGWCCLFAAALLTTGFVPVAPVLAGTGWALLALVFLLTNCTGLSNPIRFALGATLAAFAGNEIATPDLTHLALRLPSEQPLQWGDRELVTLSLKTGFALLGGLTLWLTDRPRRWLLLAAGLALASVVFSLGWRGYQAHAAERARAWSDLEHQAQALAPALEKLRLEPEEIHRPEFSALVADLAAFEQSAGQPAHFWLWAVRDNMVVHVADTASLGSQPGTPRTPPGYRYSSLYNFVLRAARGERFESGPYFVSGERRIGLHVPVRASGASAPVAWLQFSMPFQLWKTSIRDPRATAVVGLLCLGSLFAVALAGQTWLATSRRLHGLAVDAAASARAKNEMAGLVSHELRTPLQVILGHLEILAVSPQPPATERTLRVIEGQCRQLLGLVNDTLDLCALEAGRLAVRTVRFSPAALAEATVRDLRPLAAQRDLAFDLELGPNLAPLVEADAARIQQILTNLLANAIKYTPSGKVRLSVSLEAGPGSRLVFTVTDSGPGLPTAVLAHLGEVFQTGPTHQGTGLGLAVVRRLCAHLGGEFTIANAPAGGCVATVRLPAPTAIADSPSLGSQSPVTPEPPALGGIRIVLAEDNTLVREMIAGHLRSLGAEVEAVADGAAALFACRANPPDAALFDLAMPGVDGRTAARTLRNSPTSPAPRLIVGLSAEAISEVEARAAGFDRFFVKPVRLAELAAVFVPGTPAAPAVSPPPARLRQLFVSEAPGQLSALRSAVSRRDLPEVIRLAHYLQGSAYALSDEPLRRTCAALRRWAETPTDGETAGAALLAVEAEITRLLYQCG